MFRENEDEDTPLSILTSDIHGVPVTKYGIDTIIHEGILVDDYNDPDTDIFLHSKDVLHYPNTLNLGFQCISPWCQSGNFPVGKEKLTSVSNISVQHISLLVFFFQL